MKSAVVGIAFGIGGACGAFFGRSVLGSPWEARATAAASAFGGAAIGFAVSLLLKRFWKDKAKEDPG